MRANPNDLLPKPALGYVPRRSIVTVVLPFIGADQFEFNHEVYTVLGDLFHESPENWSVLRGPSEFEETSPDSPVEFGGGVLLTVTSVAVSIDRVNHAVEVLSERYNGAPITWTFGPEYGAGQVV
jgi:hypothetical protein